MKPSVFIGVPVYRDVWPATTATIDGIIARFKANGIRGSIMIAKGSAPIDRIRSELAAEFLSRADATHALCLDADIAIDPADVDVMLAIDADVVLVPYPRRPQDEEAFDGRFTVKLLQKHCDAGRYPIETRNGHRVVEVSGGGMGCALIKRDVIERLCELHPELVYAAGDEQRAVCAIFHTMIAPIDGVVRYHTEDIAFFRRVRDAGFRIYAPLDIPVNHAGYVGTLRDFFETDCTLEVARAEAAE